MIDLHRTDRTNGGQSRLVQRPISRTDRTKPYGLSETSDGLATSALSQFPITPSGTQWVQVGATLCQRGRQCGPNSVTMRARCGRGAGSCFLSPKKSGEK